MRMDIDDLREFFADYANGYLDYHSRGDDMPRPMEDFDFAYEGDAPLDIARAVLNGYHWHTDRRGAFDANAEYYFYNGYSNPVSLYACELEDYYASVLDADNFAAYLVEVGALGTDEGEEGKE